MPSSNPRVRQIRTIHPIGQGGFASEYFPESDESYIYDCGTSTDLGGAKATEKFLRASILSKEIAALFISHFDEDHVNLIPVIFRKLKIRRVFIPFASDETKNLIRILFKSQEVVEMLTNPQQYFGPEAAVIEIDEMNDGTSLAEDVEQAATLRSRRAPSGFGVQPAAQGWEYRFFNVKTDERRRNFLQMCEQEQPPIDTKRLGDLAYVNANRAGLKRVYKKVKGGINQNSLLVYSGPITGDFTMATCCPFLFELPAACFYTGDYDGSHAKDVIAKLDRDRIRRLGLVQIPHHGARSNLDNDLLTQLGECPRFFVQAGMRNRYGHPSLAVLQKLSSLYPGSVMHIVQDCSASTFVQSIIKL